MGAVWTTKTIEKRDAGIHHGTSTGRCLLHSVDICTVFHDALRFGLCCGEFRSKHAKDRGKYLKAKHRAPSKKTSFQYRLARWNCWKLHPKNKWGWATTFMQNESAIWNCCWPTGQAQTQIPISGGGASKLLCYLVPGKPHIIKDLWPCNYMS